VALDDEDADGATLDDEDGVGAGTKTARLLMRGWRW
jgi:hypothetical protein